MDQNIQQTPQQEVSQSILKQDVNQEVSHTILLKVLLIVLGVLIVVGFIGVYYLSVRKMPSTNSRTQSITNTPTNAPSQTGNGNIYKNNQFGYTIMYPSDWQAVESLPTPVTYPPITEQPQYGGYLQKGELQKTTFVKSDIGSCSLSVLENPNHENVAQWASSYKALSATGANLAKVTGDTTMGGSSAKTISIFAFDHNNTAIVAEHTNNIYFFEYSDTKGNPNYTSQQQTAEAICLQIVSSFQFLPM